MTTVDKSRKQGWRLSRWFAVVAMKLAEPEMTRRPILSVSRSAIGGEIKSGRSRDVALFFEYCAATDEPHARYDPVDDA